MMELLLDTHIFLWFLNADKQLPQVIRDQIRDPQNNVYLSVVSLWEIIIKNRLGKLPLPYPPGVYIPQERERHQINSLTLDEACVDRLGKLPALHRGPFDRMLICQAFEMGFTLVTMDHAVLHYGVATLKF